MCYCKNVDPMNFEDAVDRARIIEAAINSMSLDLNSI